MQRTVKKEFATFLTTAGVELMSRVMRGDATIKFEKCRVGNGLWSVVKSGDEFDIDVPDALLQPIDDGLFDIDTLTASSSGVTEARVNVPPAFGPATITEAEWLLDDGTVYAITRYAPVPVMPPASGSASEVALRAFMRVGDVEAVTLVVESGITASRDYVDVEVGKVDQALKDRADQLDSRVDDLPVSYLVTAPTLTGDTEQAYGNDVNLSVSGGVSSWHNTAAAAVIDHYEWLKPDGSVVLGSALVWPVPNDAALVDTVYVFKVRAIDSLGNKSGWVDRDVTVVGNRRPDMAGFTNDVPSIAVKNQALQVRFSGAVDPDGDDAQITYRITSPVNVVASKSVGIDANEAVTLTFADVSEDSSAEITVVAVDQVGTQSAPVMIAVDLRHQAIVEKPTGLAPAAGAANISQQPNIAGTAFATNPDGFDVHSATEIRVATDVGMAALVTTMTLGAVTSAQIDEMLALDTPYWYQIRYEAGVLGWSEWSDPIGFRTVAAELPQSVFSTMLYTGNGLTQSVSNGVDLAGSGGLLWIKCRDTAYQPGQNLYDSARDAGYRLSTDSSNGQDSNGGHTFADDGFSLDANPDNVSGKTYASWAFRKAPKFFDVVKYVGDGSAARQVAHELGIVPGVMIVKNISRAETPWAAFHRSIGADKWLKLNTEGEESAAFDPWGNALPTDTDFTVSDRGQDGEFAANYAGDEYIAYLFAHDPGTDGIVQCGAADFGQVISLGWKAQMILGKCVQNVSGLPDMNWWLEDDQRGFANSLFPNKSDSEAVSNHVVVTDTTIQMNGGSTGDKFVYMAIRAPIPV